jgi:hypothetical protein
MMGCEIKEGNGTRLTRLHTESGTVRLVTSNRAKLHRDACQALHHGMFPELDRYWHVHATTNMIECKHATQPNRTLALRACEC